LRTSAFCRLAEARPITECDIDPWVDPSTVVLIGTWMASDVHVVGPQPSTPAAAG
jgi:hypothetical protein